MGNVLFFIAIVIYIKCTNTHLCISNSIVLPVSASDISASVDPQAYAALGSIINIVCLSDEANPTATIDWSLNEVTPEISEVTENSCCNAKRRQSKITISNVQRSNHGQHISCSIPGTSVLKMVTLSVACKSYYLDISYPTENILI